MPIITGDIGPAITELRKAYISILKYLDDYEAKNYNNTTSDYKNKMPVLGVAPKGRRKETGWYKPSSWEDKAAQGFGKLGAMPASAAVHGEVFLAGEILNQPKEDIVKVLIHQAIHQVAAEPSNTSYHSSTFGSKANRYGIGVSIKEGWGHFDFTYPKHWRDFIAQVAANIDSTSLNVHRRPEEEISVGTGKMRLWVCRCNKPKLRTGGTLFGTCDKCGHPFMYADRPRLCDKPASECPGGIDPSYPHYDSAFVKTFERAITKGMMYASSPTLNVPWTRRIMAADTSKCADKSCGLCYP